jgi:hypothetical protein
MTTREKSGQEADRNLNDIVREADEYYRYIIAKDASGTRLDVIAVSTVVWFAAFIAFALASLATIGCLSPSTFSSCVSGPSPSKVLLQYLILSAGGALVTSAGAGITTYAIRRKRRSRFAELGALLTKMKGGVASSEDGLHLMDAMHQAAQVVNKRKVDSAFEYGVVAFILVGLFGQNALAPILAGALAYLYLREKALREYERDEKRYEDSKKELFQNL